MVATSGHIRFSMKANGGGDGSGCERSLGFATCSIRAVLVRSQSFAGSQAMRHALICSAKKPALATISRQIAAVSRTNANLSREAPPLGPTSASDIQIARPYDTAEGFEVLSGRWVVERTFAWLRRPPQWLTQNKFPNLQHNTKATILSRTSHASRSGFLNRSQY